MTNLLLYSIVILVWGSTWIAIKFQLGVVPPEASVAYRFIIASALMFIWALALRLPLRFSIRDHGFVALQGSLLFSTNFFLFYLAAEYLSTGLLAVVFSTASIITLAIKSLRERHLPAPSSLAGGVVGALGIAIIFWPDLTAAASRPGAGTGLLLAICATISFSLGGIVAARNQNAGLSVRGSTAWAMLYGALLLSLTAILRGETFTFDPAAPYIASLLYLAVFGSVIAFACYFALLNRIGTERSAYVTVLFPIVALSLSSLFEGYQWSTSALLGIALTLIGNILIQRR